MKEIITSYLLIIEDDVNHKEWIENSPLDDDGLSDDEIDTVVFIYGSKKIPVDAWLVNGSPITVKVPHKKRQKYKKKEKFINALFLSLDFNSYSTEYNIEREKYLEREERKAKREQRKLAESDSTEAEEDSSTREFNPYVRIISTPMGGSPGWRRR